jgi:hypothetical protein
VIAAFCLSALGCASDLRVYDASSNPAKGIPLATPVLVKVTTQTTYEVDPAHTDFAKYCVSDTTEKYDVMPLGDRFFVTFDSAPPGKSEFSVDFNDSGLLKNVKLNSDPRVPETIEAGAKLVSSVAEVAKAAGLAPLGIAADGQRKTAQERKKQYCIKSQESTTIQRAKLP